MRIFPRLPLPVLMYGINPCETHCRTVCSESPLIICEHSLIVNISRGWLCTSQTCGIGFSSSATIDFSSSAIISAIRLFFCLIVIKALLCVYIFENAAAKRAISKAANFAYCFYQHYHSLVGYHFNFIKVINIVYNLSALYRNSSAQIH